MNAPSRKSIFRSLLFIVSAAIIFYFLPRNDRQFYVYEMNRPWNYSLLTAPFDIPIHLDSIRAREIKDSIDNAFLPIYKRTLQVQAIVDGYATSLNTKANFLTSVEKTSLLNAVRQVLIPIHILKLLQVNCRV